MEMRKAFKQCLILGFFGCSLAAQPLLGNETDTIAGIWEGDSKCTVPDSPCHDEHVVYDIKSDPKAGGHFTVDAYKIVTGQRDFMGALDCQFTPAEHVLRCVGRRPDDIWTFTVSGRSMGGTLTIGAEKQLFRKVAVSRSEGK